MATPQQIQQAMRLAMQDGDQEAVAELRGMLTEAYQAETPDATEGMSGFEKFRAGVGQGMSNIGRHAGNLVGMVSDDDLQAAKERDRALLATGAGRAGSVVGEMAATAPIGGLAAGAARGVGAGLIAGGIGEGAAQGLLTADPGERLKGTAQGAALGAVLPGAVAAVRKVARPVAATAEARRLVREGVNLTPGELKPEGWLNQTEQALQSSPFFGSALKRARDKSMTDFQRAVAQKATPAGTTIGKTSDVNEMVRQSQRGWDQGYERAIGGYDALEPRIVRTQGGDIPLHTYNGPQGPTGAMVDASRAAYPGRLVKPDARTEMLGALESELSPLNKLRTSGRELQGVRSNIRSMARDTDVPGERAILGGGERKITEALESQLRPEDMAALRALDAQYPEFKILQDVTKRGGDQPGGWTPAQLSQAVRGATDLGEYSRGGGKLRQLAKAGRKVFEQRSMPTGERQVTLGVLGKAGLPLAAAAMKGATMIPAKALVGTTGPQKQLQDMLRRLAVQYGSEAKALEALGTAGLIQNYQE